VYTILWRRSPSLWIFPSGSGNAFGHIAFPCSGITFCFSLIRVSPFPESIPASSVFDDVHPLLPFCYLQPISPHVISFPCTERYLSTKRLFFFLFVS